MQTELNIGTIGHVDHGKTTIVNLITGKWADTHSEEIKRGITIKLGYADCAFYKCPSCSGDEAYTNKEECPKCKAKCQLLRRVSFVDSPGHETLMATVISASSIMDGALFIIAANEKCPQPQTVEHLMALQAAGIKNVVVVQNKVDLVSREAALKHYQEIKDFLAGTEYANSEIIPIAANRGINLGSLIRSIEENIPTPKRDNTKSPKMFVARSFDINKPGCEIKGLKGGVIGGSLVQGILRKGDSIEVLPGVQKDEKEFMPLKTKILGISAGSKEVEEARPGGLIGIMTGLDPSVTRSDGLTGSVVGLENQVSRPVSSLSLKIEQIERRKGEIEKVGVNEVIVLGIGTTITLGMIKDSKKEKYEVHLKKPVSCSKGDKMAVMKRVKTSWRLYGTAEVL